MSGWNVALGLHNPGAFTQMIIYLFIVIYELKSFLRVGLVYTYRELIMKFRLEN